MRREEHYTEINLWVSGYAERYNFFRRKGRARDEKYARDGGRETRSYSSIMVINHQDWEVMLWRVASMRMRARSMRRKDAIHRAARNFKCPTSTPKLEHYYEVEFDRRNNYARPPPHRLIFPFDLEAIRDIFQFTINDFCYPALVAGDYE